MSTKRKCPCGRRAEYICECGCLCCGSDPCLYNCGGSVHHLGEGLKMGIIPRSDLKKRRLAVLTTLGINGQEAFKILHGEESLGRFFMGFPESMNDEKSIAEQSAALGAKRFNQIKQIIWGNSEAAEKAHGEQQTLEGEFV